MITTELAKTAYHEIKRYEGMKADLERLKASESLRIDWDGGGHATLESVWSPGALVLVRSAIQEFLEAEIEGIRSKLARIGIEAGA